MDTSKSQYLSELLLHCEEKETGTIFITDNVNHSCQIVINEGVITSMGFGQLKGDEVLASLLIMKIVRLSFRKDLILPMRPEAAVSSSKEILQSLATQKPEDITPPSQTTTPKAKSKKPIVIYRGQVVQDTSPIETPEHIPAPEVKSKKPLRIYRGQVVHG